MNNCKGEFLYSPVGLIFGHKYTSFGRIWLFGVFGVFEDQTTCSQPGLIFLNDTFIWVRGRISNSQTEHGAIFWSYTMA